MFVFITFFLLFQINSEEIEKKSISKIKAVIFDLDGTLINNQHFYDEIHQILINKYGNGKVYTPEYKKFIHGTSSTFGNRFIIEQFKININLEEFLKIKTNFLKEKLISNNATEGAKELTNNLKHKYNLKTAIATSSYKDSVEYKLSNHKEWIDSDIDLIITGEDKRIKSGKPSPDIFILTANILGVKLEECIIIQDSIYGVKAAISAGARIVIGLPDGLSSKYVMETFQFDQYKTKLIILNSLKDFDYSILDSF